MQNITIWIEYDRIKNEIHIIAVSIFFLNMLFFLSIHFNNAYV